MSETIPEIVREMRDGNNVSESCGDSCDCPKTDSVLQRFADRLESAYQFHLSNGSMCTMECVSLGGEINQYIEQIKSLYAENRRLKEVLIDAMGTCVDCEHTCDLCINLNKFWIPKARKVLGMREVS